MAEFTHFNQEGKAFMVDVTEKEETVREARAHGCIHMSPDCLKMVEEGTAQKGDVLGTARIAAIMGAKRTSELIPLCHILNLTKVEAEFAIRREASLIELTVTAKTTGRTGVEMEALTGVSIGLLTIYDMCKAVDKRMQLGEIYLCEKTGGKSGDWVR